MSTTKVSSNMIDLTDNFAFTGTVTGAGSIVQVVNIIDTTLSTGTTTYNADDTIPQNTEGDEIFTLAITPTSATNKLLIMVQSGLLSNSATNNGISIMLFQDSTAGALSATRHLQSLGTGPITSTLQHFMTAGTTSETTFKVRSGGNNAGTTDWNGHGGARKFGGVCNSGMTIMEIAV